MQSEFCPTCRTVKTMMETVVPRTASGKDGKLKAIVIKTYYCESCRSFVRSMEEDPA